MRLFVSCGALLLVACTPPPTLDGGWGGRAICENDEVIDTDAILDATPATGALEGVFFLDLHVDLGLFGTLDTVQRGTIRDGTVSEDGTTVAGALDRDPEDAGGNTRNYAFEATVDDEWLVLEGTLDWVNGDGDSVLACDLELERLHTED
ncbi:MAG: hypothetical protein H6737_08615 [Alphaproteobacteria bacterium]|nr:hypothetical protein [Alphaproteobacteria bacterium]